VPAAARALASLTLTTLVGADRHPPRAPADRALDDVAQGAEPVQVGAPVDVTPP
jgi:hypothetical protein